MKPVVLCLALSVTALAANAQAGAPQPARPVASGVFSGFWYEIARTPNLKELDCQGASFAFTGWAAGDFSVVQTCHHASPAGPARSTTARARILPGSQNAKFKMLLLGGLISQDYWILDHADDNLWAIMATPGGHYVWLVSRRPALDAPVQATALARVKALGFDLSRLVFPQQPAR